jgi:16S rRNA (uracil1498-N3)-methyltransferase
MAKQDSPDSAPLRSLPRFHIAQPLAPGAEIRLPDRAARHIAVLRLRQGDAILLFDGSGGEFEAELTALERNRTTALIGRHHGLERESPLRITLAQCLSGGDRMDLALQKATELGVAMVVPLASQRSVVRLSADRAERKLEHWRNVVISACEQCGRNRVPPVHAPQELHAWLAGTDDRSLRLLLSPQAPLSLADLPPPAAPGNITLLAGPEGGLAPHETDAALRAGFTPVQLGPRVLRTETAPLAALAALQMLWGDFRRTAII